MTDLEKKLGIKIVTGISECDDKCRFYPPSSCDGKPCCYCDPSSLFMNCKQEKEEE